MKPLKPADDLTPSDYVSFVLRQLALRYDPRLGRISYLADEFGWHTSTLQMWIKNGRIPPKPCKRLLKEFGRAHINIARLTGEA